MSSQGSLSPDRLRTSGKTLFKEIGALKNKRFKGLSFDSPKHYAVALEFFRAVCIYAIGLEKLEGNDSERLLETKLCEACWRRIKF